MNLLVAIDLADSSATVIDKSRQLAQALSAKLWLIHVADEDPAFVGYEVGPQYERDAVAEKFRREHSEIQGLATRLRSEGLDATALLVQGPIVETIVKEAARLDADMVIAGSHGRGAVQRLLVGSVSEGLLRHAGCPILIVPIRS